jgi:alkylated DNA nucleotide flippase Atl1
MTGPSAGQFEQALHRSRSPLRVYVEGKEVLVRNLGQFATYIDTHELTDSRFDVSTLDGDVLEGVIDDVTEETGVPWWRLVFDDGSILDAFLPDEDEALDSGLSLLEPVTVAEIGGIEILLDQLWTAASRKDLSAEQERRVLELAHLILWQRNAATPGSTPRWKLVGVVRSAMVRLAVDVPIAVIGNQTYETLSAMGWGHTAAEVGRALGIR